MEGGIARNTSEINGAYAITDHISVQANMGFRPYKSTYQDWFPDTTFVEARETTFLYQGGVGFQVNLKPKVVFENYLGIIYSQTSRNENIQFFNGNAPLETFERKSDSYAGFYLSPAVGYNGPKFRWGYMHKISYVVANSPDMAGVLMEPTAFIGFGGALKCNLQLCLPISSNNNSRPQQYFYGGISLSYQLKK